MDSVAFHRCLVLLVRSAKIRRLLAQCLLLNGLIFLGSIYVFHNIVSYILGWGLSSLFHPDSNERTVERIQNWIEWIYFVLWIIPMYVLSFVLNTLWYQDIARESMKVFPQSSSASSSSSSSITITSEIVQMIFRSLFNLIFLLYLCVLYRWRWIYALHLGWLVAYNSFEYRWISEKKSFDEKINIFEKGYIYFLSFGLPLSLFAVQFPSVVESGLISLVLPLLIMSASTAGKAPLVISLPKSLPWFDRKFLSLLERCPVLIVPESLTKLVIIATSFFQRISF